MPQIAKDRIHDSAGNHSSESPPFHPHDELKARRTNRKAPPEKVGDKLRDARMAQGIRLAEIQRKTKISRTNLMAMEESRYSELPATSFCRGLYRLYALAVGLDPETIIYQFELERNRFPERKGYLGIDFGNHNEEVEAMAGKPSFLVFSSIGLILLILIFFAVFLCWYFSWNPVAFLSQKLRSLDPQPSFEETLIQKRPTASSETIQKSLDGLFNSDISGFHKPNQNV